MRYTTSNPKFQHPVWMSPEETTEPQELLSEFCQTWTVSDCRFYLWQMLSNSVSYDQSHTDATPAMQMYFFENLMAMIEALYLSNRPVALAEHPPKPVEEDDDDELEALYSNSDLTNRLIVLIRGAVPAEATFGLSTPLSDSQELLVLVDNTEQTPILRFKEMILERISTMGVTTVSVFNSHYFRSVTERPETLYFSLVLEDLEMIYVKDGLNFAVPVLPECFPDRARLLFDGFYRKAESFYHLGERHREVGKNELTAFSCHQACELSLISLLYALTGAKDRTHHIGKKLEQARLLNRQLSPELFGGELLALLEQTYVKARYNSSFRVSDEQATALFEKTGQLIALVKETFQATRAKFDKPKKPTAEISIEDPGRASDTPARSDQQYSQSELEEFFDAYKPHDFAERWRTILEAYSAPDYYRLGSPSDVVYAIEKLSDLMKVAYEIYQQLSIEDSPDDDQEASTPIGSAHSAIRQFFAARSLEEWERCLKHVLFFALSTDDPDDGGCKVDTLWLYNVVCGLVEGCWKVRGLAL